VGFCSHPHLVSVALAATTKGRHEIRAGIVSSFRFIVLEFSFNKIFLIVPKVEDKGTD
jgi:hypothetical protein